jgi:predicted AlkP superfamily pyrophosphatase or phosphodiesterase
LKRLVLSAATLLLAACASAPPAAPPQQARTLPPNTSPGSAKVLLVSFDGVGADTLQEFARAGVIGRTGYQHIVQHGLSAGRVVPINPTLTAPTHVAIATGTTADRHGIVSNAFYSPGTSPGQWTSGYAAPITAETIWEAARRQGKRVGTISFPGADLANERRRGDWGLAWSDPVVRGRLQKLTRSDFSAEWLPPGWRGPQNGSFSPVLHARAAWIVPSGGHEVKREVVFSAFDTTDDGRENYDRIAVREGNAAAKMDGQWFAVSAEIEEEGERYLFGSWSKVLSFDDQLRQVSVYWGPISRTVGYPAAYRQMIDREAGFWPGPPDERAASDWLSGKGEVPPEIFVEQVRRFSSFFTRATLISMQKMPWDLVLSYQPIVDEAEHTFYIANERQAVYNERNVAAAAIVRRAVYETFDRAVQQMASAVDFGTTALIVTGDHGHSPLDTQVGMSRLLADWGFASVRDDRISPESDWIPYTSGHLAHIYRIRGTEGQAAELVKRLRELRSPDGDLVFEQTRQKGPGDHPNSGDIIAYAFPRFYMSSSARPPVFQKSNHYGQHGALNTHPELHTIFAAAGARVQPGRAPEIRQTEIARYVSSLMGIEPPREAE